MAIYQDDKLVKRAYRKVRYSKEQIDELKACMDPVTGPLYFMRNFMYVQHSTQGKQKFVPYDFQLDLIESYTHYKKSINMVSRQMGKTAVAAGYLLWYSMFNDDAQILVTSYKYDSAQDIMDRVRYAYESIPDHIRAGVVTYNKRSIAFDNGSKITATTTTENTGRGMSLSLVYLDDFAFVDAGIAKEFWTSLAPTLSTGGKCIITSTPNTDEDQFADIWFKANKLIDNNGNETDTGTNGFKPYMATWEAHPDRNEKWADEQLASLGEDRFLREHKCCNGETLITIQDITGDISEVTMENFFNMCKIPTIKDTLASYKNILGYKVLTPDGFNDFAGISLMAIAPTYRVTIEDGRYLDCTADHKIFINGEHKKATSELVPGDEIFTLGGFRKIISIIPTGQTEPVYDLIEVDSGHKYYTNGILSSNCQFITFEETLINPVRLFQLESTSPIRKTGQVRWYADICPSASYIVSLDPSMGTGGDNSAIQVLELPTLVQVAEWSSNRTPIEEQVKTMKKILEEIAAAGRPETYWSVENNTLGEAALVVIRDTGEENFYGTMLHDPKNKLAGGGRTRRAGFNTTNKSKLEACAKLKFLIESGKMRINSKGLLSELKVFVSRGNTYEARIGQTDDLIMAMILAVRMTEYTATWDDKSQAAINSSVNSADDNSYDSPMPLII